MISKENITVNKFISIAQKRKHKSDKSIIIFNALIKVLKTIPDFNISEKSFVLDKGTQIHLHLVHSNDLLRIVDLYLKKEFYSFKICFMYDSLIYQQKNQINWIGLNNEQFCELYFHAIFDDSFTKHICYRDNTVFEVKLCFENKNIRNRNYLELKNLLLKHLFGFKPNKIDEFKYLSFFKAYNFNVENLIIKTSLD